LVLKRFTNLFFASGTGILLWAAWPVSPFTLLIFIAWVPLLWLETKVESRKKFFGLTYIAMFIWNVATTWWVWNASAPGAVSAFLANSLIMCFPWLGFKIVKKKLGERIGYISLVAFWMCFEFIHLHDWGLSWPWLTLGNVFATHPEWIQWYEYTGTSGGTLWVLLSNILLFQFITEYRQKGRSTKYFVLIFTWFLLLIVPSVLYFNLTKTNKVATVENSNIVVVQPNIDPYEKIAVGTSEAQLQKLIHLSEKTIDSNTALVIWPETALFTGGLDEDKLKENYFLAPLWGFLQRHPGITLFTGIESYKTYPGKATSTAKAADGLYYDSFNSSVILDSAGSLAFYHKSMLVPGVETLPWFLHFLDTWFEKFGGTTAGYAKQKERTVLTTASGYKIAPAICYESIYGEFMSRYAHNGANIICIITNDGWWQNTPGYKQHMNYARLRAIETRKWIARSANTGISCFIDSRGNVIDPQPWDKAAAIKLNVTLDSSQTFFVKYGDILSRLAVIASIILLVINIFASIRKRLKKQ
jgi:apolipoprotein N-acyltransferase